MSSPLWLSNSPVRELLGFIVDKLDAANVQGKPLARALRLDERSFPGLFKAELETEKEQLWSYVEQMSAWGWFRIRHDRVKQGQAKYECNPRIDVLDETAIRAAAGRPNRVPSAGEVWRDAVYSCLDASDDIRELVARSRIDISGRSASEVVTQLNLLPPLKNEPLLLREVSARLFWGLSKVLDNRQALVAALLRADECPFPEMPVQLQVFLPKTGFEGALFIENQTTFEQATRDDSPRFAGLALVFASGFKGTAKRLRSVDGASVYFASNGSLGVLDTEKFLRWLRGSGGRRPSWFWGDLDYSGMQILAGLKESFPELEAWQPGYAPMLQLLMEGGGHLPESGGKQLQRQTTVTGSSYADEQLIPAMTRTGRFVDQELS